MKKTLLALAVLAVSGAAMAQSSVTLYGVADAGLGRIKTGSTGTSPANDASNQTEFISGSRMNNGDSRIGVRGVEDVGGGLKVGFNFESGLDLDNGNATTTAFWARQANVWLGGNWGTFKMGRAFSPSYGGVAVWELTGASNYSVVANTFNYGGSGSRNNSQFSYKTPGGLGGFSAELGYITKADNAAKAKWDFNVIYANGPISAAFTANKQQQDKTGYTLGGKYDFGSFAVAASYNDARKVRRGFTIGGTAKFGAFSVTADVARDTKSQSGKKFTNVLLEGKYALSKRTFVYLAGLRLDGSTNYGVGVRHNF
ncbi:porin [Ottowia thiooxydans]|uniref:porin n=1 Tax=Ottowia thiooxydans TaxID=219182 RepID=UPI00042756E0|nr:porin [Ottowia thiooxydans]